MPSFVRLLTALATVMHLTCGCCWHAAHLADGGHGRHDTACCPAAATCIAHAPEGCECEGHACPEESAAPAPAETTNLLVTAPLGGDHDCSGCDCVADASATDVAAAWRPFERGVAAAVDARLIVAATTAVARAGDDGRPPAVAERHPLHERLLI